MSSTNQKDCILIYEEPKDKNNKKFVINILKIINLIFIIIKLYNHIYKRIKFPEKKN